MTVEARVVEERAGDASELPTGWASWSSSQLLALVDCGRLLDDDADLVITELALRSTGDRRRLIPRDERYETTFGQVPVSCWTIGAKASTWSAGRQMYE